MELMKLQSDHKPGNCRVALAGVVRFYETLAPDTLDQLSGLYAADARFKDPFNDVVGIAAITGIFQHMFTTVEAPRFEVTTRLLTGLAALALAACDVVSPSASYPVPSCRGGSWRRSQRPPSPRPGRRSSTQRR